MCSSQSATITDVPPSRSCSRTGWSAGASVMTPLTLVRGSTVNGEAAPIFSDAGQHVGVGGPGGEGPLHRGLVRVSGRQPGLVVDAGDAEQEDVGVDRLGRFHGGGAARDGGVLEQSSAEQEDLDRRVVEEGGRHRRAVRHQADPQVARQRPGHRERGGSAVEEHRGPGPDQPDRGDRHPLLALGGHGAAGGVVGHGGGDRQRAAVHPLAQPGGRELAQVPADAVLGDPELGGEVLRDEAPVALEPGEEEVSPLRWQHCVVLLDLACLCVLWGTVPP